MSSDKKRNGIGSDPDNRKFTLSGRREKERVTLEDSENGVKALIQDGKARVLRDGALLAELDRIERTSPTLGALPPEGAVVLFDGTTADAWIDGSVEDGLLVNSDVASKETFHDYFLHLEFRTPYKPFARGQRRGNSGVYHQGRYETQVLDSFGLEGRHNECGGIYSIAAPRLNACLPPLAWQTYDVQFTAARFDAKGRLEKDARMTVRLNGILIHDDVALPHTTTAAPIKSITSEPGPIFLQQHKNPVYYRNIWLVRK